MVKKILILLLISGKMIVAWAQPAENMEQKRTAPPTQVAGFAPDELDARIKMITNRIAFGDEPKLTEDFIVACVTLDPKFDRRFTEFSGDQCGRYLSTFSRIQVKGNPVDIREVARKIVLTQKADGRFGNDQLNFDDPTKLEGNHMALLWGNGRLLTGLMDYYVVSKDPAVLQSAIKLGNFLLKTARSCMQKTVVERFKTMGAMGYICFTQITDGLVKLYEQTSDKNYLQSASAIYPLLPPLGNQHSHGFLNTLLGVMHLYSATHDLQHLAYVEKIYAQVLEAPDFLISGGVPEFFNAEGTKPGSRDEGCSEADFIMVSLELWKATGKMLYLEKAEYCLYNELMYNQFNSGDFGSHPIGMNFGFEVATSPGQCWGAVTTTDCRLCWKPEKSLSPTTTDKNRSIFLPIPITGIQIWPSPFPKFLREVPPTHSGLIPVKMLRNQSPSESPPGQKRFPSLSTAKRSMAKKRTDTCWSRGSGQNLTSFK